jgi:hypothetical protein
MPEAPARFSLGDAPFWAADRIVEPDAWVGHIPFAFWIVEALRPRLLVELGTHTGNSYLAFAQAVQRLELDSACFAVDTWRGDPHAGYYGEDVFLELSEYHDTRYGAFSRLIRATFDDASRQFPDASVDLLHVDGCHTYEAVGHDFEVWRAKLSTRAVVLFHDTNVREGDFGVWRLWDELRAVHPHFEFLHHHGLGVLGVGSNLPTAVMALFDTTRDAAGAGRIRHAFARLGISLQEHIRLKSLQDEVKARVAETEEQLRLTNGLQHEIVRLGRELRDSKEKTHRMETSEEARILRAELSALHQSRSLRLTRPLRQAAGWYRMAMVRARRGGPSR